MDELALVSVPGNCAGVGVGLLLEQVDVFREAAVKGRDWGEVARCQYDGIFRGVTDASDEDLRLIAGIYEEENVGRVVDGSRVRPAFEPLDSPLEDISLSLDVDGTGCREGFRLTPKDDGREIETPHGRFRRVKLRVLCMDQDLVIPERVKIEATVCFQGPPEFSTSLSLDAVVVPAGDNDGKSMVRWIQLGMLEEKLVLQLGFRSQPCERTEMRRTDFVLEQAFLSQPLPESS